MFKNPKLIKIAELYNRIVKDFNVDSVYITDIFHPRDINRIINVPIKIEVETYKDHNDDEILFRWTDIGDDHFTFTYLIEDCTNEDIILDSIIRALESVYCDYKVINEEVITLLNKVGRNSLTKRILMQSLNSKI